MRGESQSATATPMGSGATYERVPIDSLTPDPRNARSHGTKNMAAIVESLRRFGQQKPIVVDASGTVLAGNATIEAAKELGWTHIEIARSSLTGTDAMAYAIADNRTAELAEWDWQELKAQLGELEADGWDLSDLALDPSSLSVPEEIGLGEQGEDADRENDPIYEAIADAVTPEEVPDRGTLWQVGGSLLVIACPIGDLELWKPLLTDDVEMVVPYPSAWVSVADRFKDSRCLFIQPVGVAAAYLLRVARAAGVEVSEVRR